jgi:hypothetical protein
MNIEIEWHQDQFNVNLANKPGETFLSIKGCRLVDGADGTFVGYPATKNATTGKWWRHAWGSDKFNAAVLEKAMASRPSSGGRRPSRDDDGDPIPF